MKASNKFDLHQEIVRVIKEKTPDDINPVDLLHEIIPIRKESLYRRLRGEMPFTLEEVSKITLYLGISLDKLLPRKPDNSYHVKLVKNDAETDYGKVIESLNIVKNSPAAHYYVVTNGLPSSHMHKYDSLSKFEIFLKNYQDRKDAMPLKMSEFTVSPLIREYEISYSNSIQQIPSSYIWMKNMVQPFVDNVHYFSQIGLLSQKEIEIIKYEAHSFLNDLERDTFAGETPYGKPFTVYLSNNFFDNCCFYMESDQYKGAFIKIFKGNFLLSSDQDFCDKMKGWIFSLMKYSVLISKSGIVERLQFFKQQRNLIDSI